LGKKLGGVLREKEHMFSQVKALFLLKTFEEKHTGKLGSLIEESSFVIITKGHGAKKWVGTNKARLA